MWVFCENEHGTLYHGDCLEVMDWLAVIETKVDMVLCDPPYGTTACKWDAVIPFEPMWEAISLLVQNNQAIVLSAAQPFTSVLANSNLRGLKHHWIWDKVTGTGFQVAKYRPMMRTEDILVFTLTGKKVNYFPVMVPLDKPRVEKYAGTKSGSSPIANLGKGGREVTHRYPKNLLQFKRDGKRVHPTQKPVALFEYLIRTYTLPGETVLDFCAGSGTTAIAAQNTGRKWILCEKEEKYCEIIVKRLEDNDA